MKKRKSFFKKVKKNNPIKAYFEHKTKRKVLIRFLIILAIVFVYSSFSIYSYGLKNGILVSFLTWSLFVFCTPIADAGFLIDFPVRFFTKIRMIYSEASVWAFAILLNLSMLLFSPEVYQKTPLLILFKTILLNPFPFWAIIAISFAGTFLSIYFGDELLDSIHSHELVKHKKHKNKLKMIITFFVILSLIGLYYYLIRFLGVHF